MTFSFFFFPLAFKRLPIRHEISCEIFRIIPILLLMLLTWICQIVFPFKIAAAEFEKKNFFLLSLFKC